MTSVQDQNITLRQALQAITDFLAVREAVSESVISGRWQLQFNFQADPRFAGKRHNGSPVILGNAEAGLSYLAELLADAHIALASTVEPILAPAECAR